MNDVLKEETTTLAEPSAAATFGAPLAVGSRLQEFEITGLIGQGGFGIVYLARDLSLQRQVAIKEYMPAQLACRDGDATLRPLSHGHADMFELGRRSFLNEARLLARFRHPGLLEVLRFWEQNGTAYMVMPYYEGVTLTEHLRKHSAAVDEAWLISTLSPVIDALEHMHAANCFHRDVAPDNILMRPDGHGLLLDFGAARRVIGDRAQALTVMLKPGFAPIEQYADDPGLAQGPYTDIYALSAVMYFAIVGKVPPAAASRLMHDTMAPLATLQRPGFSFEFLAALDHGLAVRPEKRPQSIAAFRNELFAGASAPERSSVMPTVMPSTSPAGIDAAGDLEAPTLVVDPDRDPDPDDAGLPRSAVPAQVPAAAAADDGTAVAMGTVAGRGRRAGAIAAGAAILLLAALGWRLSSPPQTLPPAAAGADASRADRYADASPEQVSSPRAAAADVATEPSTADVATEPPAAGVVTEPSAAGAAAEPAAAAVATEPPAGNAAPAAGAAVEPPTAAAQPAAAKTGTVRLAVKPWAEVWVDGVNRGISPPLKSLTLEAGQHTIELRNSGAKPSTRRIEVKGGKHVVVRHQF